VFKRLSADASTVRFALLVFALAVMAGISMRNYLLFHVIAELFSIIVAFGIAAIALHTRHYAPEDEALSFLGVAYFFIAIFDLFHTLAYNGMGVFPGDTANLATQLWIIPRYLQGVTFLLITFDVPRHLGVKEVFGGFFAVSLLAGSAVYFGYFPDCFLPASGLTAFKIISEYIISAMFLVAVLILYRKRATLDPKVYKYMMLACLTAIASEIHFTTYVSVYGMANMFGHLWKVASFYFVYELILRKKLMEPYEKWIDLYHNMERKVATRTRELEAANLRLREGQRVLKQLNRKLSENNRLKSEFMATVTHELRTPLTSIVAFCELLLDEAVGPLNEEQRENLMDINIGAQQLMILISDILDMNKYEAGRLRLYPEKVEINDVFTIVRRTMLPITSQHRLELQIKKAEIPLIFGDPERIRQMIINLISNAVKFTPEGGSITVSATVENGQAAISVKDTGEGIAPEFLPHIFEKFRQGDSSLKRRRSGTGLGLALVKTLAELQHGSVAVKSEVGVGTEFIIYLPLAAEDGDGLLEETDQAPALW